MDFPAYAVVEVAAPRVWRTPLAPADSCIAGPGEPRTGDVALFEDAEAALTPDLAGLGRVGRSRSA